MDNRITKKRLGHMFSYEWIIIIALCVAMVFVWELCYSFFSVKLTAGQQFRLIYDYKIDDYSAEALMDMFETENTFSYEVQEKDFESILKGSDVLNMRHQSGMCDAIITDAVLTENKKNEKTHTRANEIIDRYDMYAYDELVSDAKEYLNSLKENGDYSEEKIEQGFYKRNSKDNRFRSEEQKKQGLIKEIARINQLEQDVLVVEKLLAFDQTQVSGGGESIFYSYKRYTQSLSESTNKESTTYFENLVANEVEQKYGLKLWLLEGSADKKNSANYFRLTSSETDLEKDVVLLIFDMKDKKHDLQFELISFVATIVREFSDIAG